MICTFLFSRLSRNDRLVKLVKCPSVRPSVRPLSTFGWADVDETVPVRESAGTRVRGATSPRGRESIYIHRCTVPAVNNAGSTTGCRDAIDEYNSYKKYFFTGEVAALPPQTPPRTPPPHCYN